MENVGPKRWALLPLVFACATVGLTAAREAAAQTDSASGGSSFGQSITSGFQNLGGSTTPPPSQAEDPISLKTPAKAGVELYVAVARLYAESGKLTEAEEQYQQAMKKFPNNIHVLLGYAMLKDQMNQPEEALKLYRQAEQKHPKQAAVYNNLAVHYARWGMVREAIEAGQRAVELHPREARYRNNLAALLVEAGMPQEAFKQLREIYDEPVAHYDLGFLLNKRGMKAGALQEFTIALRLNPGMGLARQWVQRLSLERGDSSPAMIGMLPPRGQVPAAVATNPSFPCEAVPPPPPTAPSPPPFMTPPPYAASPPDVNQGPPPAQVQYPAQFPASAPGPDPAQVQYSAQARWYPFPQQNPPQSAGPPTTGPPSAGPQYTVAPQYPNAASPPPANPVPILASRDPQASGVRVIPAPAADDNALRRLPPVNDPRWQQDANLQGQGPENVAPDPPGWRR